MTLRELLDRAVNAEQTEPAFFWDVAEKKLLEGLLNGLVIELTNACLWQGAEREMLVDVLQGEDFPQYIVDSITDARNRLEAAGKLDDDYRAACDHTRHFLENRQELLAAKRGEQKNSIEGEIDELMRKLGVVVI